MTAYLDTDALIVGGGPAGTATAILLAQAGMRVSLVEQHEFPRQKVCGECISAGALAILDELGIGEAVRGVAGPEIRRVGWMGTTRTIIAPFPRCAVGTHDYGRAIGRDRLDGLLMSRAKVLGVHVLQPARVRRVAGTPGHFSCDVETRETNRNGFSGSSLVTRVWAAKVVIDAHGSWERAPSMAESDAAEEQSRRPKGKGDLFAFKATFAHSSLPVGLLPVIAFPGGYGGIVVADKGRTTLACCIRRDALCASRSSDPKRSAGAAVAATLQESCPGVVEALEGATQEIGWLSVGPIRPGIRVDGCRSIFRVGNAAGESHPLIGEGINMALHSARLAAVQVSRLFLATVDAPRLLAANRAYACEWRAAFGSRLRYARWYASMAMRPAFARPLTTLLEATPTLLTHAARWAGKARGSVSIQLEGRP